MNVRYYKSTDLSQNTMAAITFHSIIPHFSRTAPH